jgi:hypothetical protein
MLVLQGPHAVPSSRFVRHRAILGIDETAWRGGETVARVDMSPKETGHIVCGFERLPLVSCGGT